MKCRGKWGALSVDGHVAPAKISNGGDACRCRNNVGVSNLEGELMVAMGVMSNGLPMTSNGLDIFCANLAFIHELQCRFREVIAQQVI